jgi:RNA polymerase sigma-70 factor, ECF subfamily
VSMRPAVAPDPAMGLLALYDEALPHVYGYLLSRCGDAALAEDLTADCFLAAVTAARKPDVPPLGIPWLIGVARHKLVDHWRAREREERGLRLVSGDLPDADDPWDEELDVLAARTALAQLGSHHRAALTLRYLDGLPVAEVAEYLGRSVHATEALLVRARNAFRRTYSGRSGKSGEEGSR